MNLKKTLIIATVLSCSSLAGWEVYWRSHGKRAKLDDDKALWAVQRAKIDQLTNSDVVIAGSSRVLFDIQLDQWESVTGRKPLQLASPGSSPLPVFRDLVRNTDFAGTIVVGVTPGLFFSTTYPEAFPWKRPQTKVNHFHTRTPAQRLNHQLSIPLQQSLALMSASEEEWSDDIDLRALVRRVRMPGRTGSPEFPPFYDFHDTRLDRNTIVSQRVLTDTAFCGSIKKVWMMIGKGSPPPDKNSTMGYFLEDLQIFKARGGRVILVRCPSSGMVRAGEDRAMPRQQFWDELVKAANVKSYYYADYPQLPSECPEWSHLAQSDAQIFTRGLLQIMMADGALPNTQKN